MSTPHLIKFTLSIGLHQFGCLHLKLLIHRWYYIPLHNQIINHTSFSNYLTMLYGSDEFNSLTSNVWVINLNGPGPTPSPGEPLRTVAVDSLEVCLFLLWFMDVPINYGLLSIWPLWVSSSSQWSIIKVYRLLLVVLGDVWWCGHPLGFDMVYRNISSVFL